MGGTLDAIMDVYFLCTVLLFWASSLTVRSDAQVDCPKLHGEDGWWPKSFTKSNDSGYYLANDAKVHRAHLSNPTGFVERMVDRIQQREKRFFRFRIPAGELGVLTVIWVTEDRKSMLHYPQNFDTISTATLNILTENIHEKDLQWTCPNGSRTCVLTKRQVEELVNEITAKTSTTYKYLCIQADHYGISFIVNDYANEKTLGMFNARNFALPDMLYYWYYLKLLFVVYRPPFGLHHSSNEQDFPNYYCYHANNECEIKELHIRYFLVVYIAIGVWLFTPLLIYYFPSKKPARIEPHPPASPTSEMIPAYTSPVHFSRCLKTLLCYYSSPNKRYIDFTLRIRRALFMMFLGTFSFRVFMYFNYSILLFFVLVLFVCCPKYMSIHINPEIPKSFPLFPNSPYPPHLLGWNSLRDLKKEYQLLAYIMQERIFMAFSIRFWKYILFNSFESFHNVYTTPTNGLSGLSLSSKCYYASGYFIKGVFLILSSFIIVVLYFLNPLPFFIKEMSVAIFRGTSSNLQQQRTQLSVITVPLKVVSGGVMLIALLYTVVAAFVICYLATEIAMFTYMGAALTPKIALKFVALVVSSGTAIYSMIHTLHEQYNSLMDTMVNLLTTNNTFLALQARIKAIPNGKLELLKHAANGEIYLHKIGEPADIIYKKILVTDCITSYVSEDAFFSTVDYQLPIRKQVVFVILKAISAISFILLAMTMKNVFHLNKEVEDIFSFASKIAVSFLPTFLQFMAYRNKFAHKQEMIQKRESIEAIVTWISNIKP